jgi:hypothetical protein
MLLYDTQERCIVCETNLEVWFYRKGQIVLWCPVCLATTVFDEPQASLFAPTQPTLEVLDAD